MCPSAWRPQAVNHENRAASRAPAPATQQRAHDLGTRPRFLGRANARWLLSTRADPIGFGRGIVELHVEGCLLRAATAI